MTEYKRTPEEIATLKAINKARIARESKAGTISYSYKHLGHKLVRLPLDSYKRD